jgi:hypothetical protein
MGSGVCGVEMKSDEIRAYDQSITGTEERLGSVPGGSYCEYTNALAESQDQLLAGKRVGFSTVGCLGWVASR